jgi:hypothetical protein
MELSVMEMVTPREALCSGEPPIEAVIIPWQKEDWEYLGYCKRYCEANPNDILNYIVYRNLIKYYASGRGHRDQQIRKS